MKTATSSLLVLLMSTLALASTSNTQVTNISGNGNSNKNGDQHGNEIKTKLNVNAARRSLSSLFRRDPDFEFAMGILERNANAAEQSVDQIVASIHAGTVDPAITQAALDTKLITKAPGFTGKRSALPRGRGSNSKGKSGGKTKSKGNSLHISGPKGQAHSSDQVAQHIKANGYIPPKIKQALVASKHYLVPGQTPDNPTAPPGSGAALGAAPAGASSAAGAGPAGGASAAPGAGPAGGASAAPGAAPAVTGRDLSGLYAREISDLYARDLDSLYARDVAELYERDFDGLYERDIDALIERDLNDFFAREAAKVTTDEILGLANAIQRDPKAKKAVYKALTMDPNVEKVTEQLVADWTTESDMQKRDAFAEAEAYYEALEARDAEAEAYYEFLEARDAEAEAEAEE